MAGDDRSEADKADRTGEEPAVESGAGYGDHAPAPEEDEGREDDGN